MAGIRAVFFDMGGTLAHPRPSFPGLLAQVCQEHGLPVTPEQAQQAEPAVWTKINERPEAAHGFTLSLQQSRSFWLWVYRIFLAELGYQRADQLPEQLFAAFTRPEGYQLYEDVIPSLERLIRAGYILGIISNWEAWAEELIDRLEVRRYFHCTLVSGRIGIEKPDPEIFHRALAAAGASPHEAIHVGDNPEIDVQAAQRAGLGAVLLDRASPPRILPVGPRPEGSLSNDGPAPRIHSLLELPPLLAVEHSG